MSDLVSRRLARSMVSVGVASLTLAASGRAQSVADARRELDSLVPALREATARVERADRDRLRAAGAMRVDRGVLRLSVDSAIATVMADAATRASASIEHVFGESARSASDYVIGGRLETVLSGRDTAEVIRVRRIDPDSMSSKAAIVRSAGSSERTVAVRGPAETEAALTVALEAVGTAPMHASLDDALRFWFRSALPATSESRDELENLYIDLTTASTEISRGCLAGDVSRCRQVLGFDALTDPIVEAYTAAMRRQLVEGAAARLRTLATAAQFDRCVVGMADTACIGRLRELSPDAFPSAYSTTAARRSFARWALAKGGEGAYARLRASTDRPLIDRFALAAGMSADALVASWHAHLMSGRPAHPSIPPVTAVATILWIGAFGGLALRSSRWR